jgi:hypothetical protein
MGPYTAILGVLVFVVVVAGIGAVDVIRGRQQGHVRRVGQNLEASRPVARPVAHS